MKGPHKARFEAIYQNGRRIKGNVLRVICLEGNGAIGITTAKAIGSKPQRNRQKRRIRSVLLGILPGNAQKDWVFQGLNGIQSVSFQDLRVEAEGLIQKLIES